MSELYVCKQYETPYERVCKIITTLEEHDKQIREEAIDEVARAMYHQCFECNNDENMQKWDSGNWFRYKLFEKVVEQLKE